MRDPEVDPAFTRLLAETRMTVAVSAFTYVLEAALDSDCATESLFEVLGQDVFIGSVLSPSREDPSVSMGEVKKMRLMSVLPGLAQWGLQVFGVYSDMFVDVSLFIQVGLSCADSLIISCVFSLIDYLRTEGDDSVHAADMHKLQYSK